MRRVKFRTNFWLWVLASLALFVPLVFVDPFTGVIWGDWSLSALWKSLITDGGKDRNVAFIAPIVVALNVVFFVWYASCCAFLASGIGWLFQAVVVVTTRALFGREPIVGRLTAAEEQEMQQREEKPEFLRWAIWGAVLATLFVVLVCLIVDSFVDKQPGMLKEGGRGIAMARVWVPGGALMGGIAGCWLAYAKRKKTRAQADATADQPRDSN